MASPTQPTRLTKLSRSIEGRAALVTGAASGMGRETARLFADEGAKVAICDVAEAALAELEKELLEAGATVVRHRLDLADPAQIESVVSAVAEAFGGLDILVNNAGISRPSPIDAEDFEASWRATLDVNLDAHYRTIRAALPYLRKSDAGRVVNVASTEGVGAQPYLAAYTASKHGVVGLTRAMAVELGRTGITFNCICPGPIHTGMTEPIPDEAKQKFARRRVPLGRYGDPEEVAQATLSLVLPAASYINGAVLMVDGGLSIKNS